MPSWSKIFGNYLDTIIRTVNLANGESSDWLVIPHHTDVSVDIYGTFGGATVVVKGANNPTDASGTTLKDALGNLISLTSADIVQILPGVYQIQVSVSGGGGGTAIKVAVKLGRGRF